ncbi:hypothetical protein [Oribacterium sp. NK2B42]|uniref:hypothetical protein n=1 Tax=Oribacterium sp. NK2B42 TaxID=689781 RepID=UPI000429471D|nr:hypothetical protein [Oribacterium sp. NK2B42]
MIDIEEYKNFMGITSFPNFQIDFFKVDLNQEFIQVAQAMYDSESGSHMLRIPSNIETPRFLLYHELTHIYDMDIHKTGEKNHDFCLNGFMEYHASQIELLIMMGAKAIEDSISFSMNDSVYGLNWSVQQYMGNKLQTSIILINDENRQKRIEGLGAFYNFLGLKSICKMFAVDYIEDYSYQEIAMKVSSQLFYEIRNTMTGWIGDIDKVVSLYSNMLAAIL